MAVALIVSGVGSFAYHGPQPGWAGPVHDLGVVVVAIAVVIMVVSSVRADVWRSLAPPAFVLGIAVIVQIAGRSGGVLCVPGSWAQAHAAWHLLAGVGLAMMGERGSSAA